MHLVKSFFWFCTSLRHEHAQNGSLDIARVQTNPVSLIDVKQMRFSAPALAAWPERWLRRRQARTGNQFA